MTTRQVFGSALRQPWALMVFGSNAPEGRRPGTSVVYLTDDEGDHYLGGEVMFWRGINDPQARWYYRYKHAKRIPKSDVLHIFPTTHKSPLWGPSMAQIRAARKSLPVTTKESEP